jgi:broad specificity phosphatase PhoE
LTEKLSDGKRLLQFCTKFSPSTRKIVVIRHSERISFYGVPMEQWDGIGITENGSSAAKKLGKSLAEVSGFPSANVLTWGQKRCAETASAMAEGLVEGGASISAQDNLRLSGPISDYPAYKEMILTGQWQKMLDLWQRADSRAKGLTPVAEYASSSFREILNSRNSPPNQLTIIVTHDLHILPLACHAIGTSVLLPDYLDGFVIAEQNDKMLFGYGEITKSMDNGSLMH